MGSNGRQENRNTLQALIMATIANSSVIGSLFVDEGVTTDFEPASRLYVASEVLNWIQRLRLPGVQADATREVLEYQKQQYDEIEARRIGYLDQAAREWCRCINQVLSKIEDATDDIPEPAMFQPVSPSGEQWQTVSDNLEILPTVTEYAEYINKSHAEMDMARQIVFNPNHYKTNEVVWTTLNELLEGDLPKSLVVETLTRTKEKAVKAGRFGRSSRQSARDLGITSYRVQKAARSEIREEREHQNRTISSTDRQVDLRSMMVTPQQRIAWGIQQGQLIQNSLQNAYNACARKDPHLQQEVNILLQKCQQELTLTAGKASLVNANVPDFATIFQGQNNDTFSTVSRGLSDFVGTFGFNEPGSSGATQTPGNLGNSGVQDSTGTIGSGKN